MFSMALFRQNMLCYYPSVGPEHNFVILSWNDLKHGLRVHCHNAQCSVPKPCSYVKVIVITLFFFDQF